MPLSSTVTTICPAVSATATVIRPGSPLGSSWRRASIASIAFLTILSTACPTSRASQFKTTGGSGKRVVKLMSRCALCCRYIARWTISTRFSGFRTGAGMRAKAENSSIIRPISPPQPFRGKLDRGQRVLNLMGDTAGNVGPGRFALRRQEFGDVVEGDDKTADLALIMFGDNPDQQRA